MADFFRTMALAPHPGIDLELNDETSLSHDVKEALKALLSWIIQFDPKLCKIFSETLGSLSTVANDVAALSLLKELRPMVRGNQKQVTSYKYCYASAIISRRSPKELHLVLKQIRDHLSIDSLEACSVHDAVLSECTILPSRGWEFSDDDKFGVIALCCQLLRLDGITHVAETESLRLVTIGLRVGGVSPPVLMSLMAIKPVQLFSDIKPNVRPWAILHLLRIASADGSMRPGELEFIKALEASKVMDSSLQSFIHRAHFLEKGISLPI